MVKYLSILIVIMTLSLSTMPCFLYDRCLFSGMEENCTHDDDGSCADDDFCSPFMQCNTCTGFVYPQTTSLEKIFVHVNTETVFYYKEEALKSFPANVFQPPEPDGGRLYRRLWYKLGYTLLFIEFRFAQSMKLKEVGRVVAPFGSLRS